MGRSLPFVVLDSNIFVQALLNKTGSGGKCLDLVRQGLVKLFVSAALVGEFHSVMLRPGVLSRLPGLTIDQIDAFAAEILYISNFVESISSEYSFDRDPKDQFIIDLAIECEAEFVVTWDKDLLDLMTGTDIESKQFRQRFRHLKIVKPDEFLRIVLNRELPLEP